ncbi:MAG: HAMP domain-containing sensor histidine kinase [Patescibacteria group bacterium]
MLNKLALRANILAFIVATSTLFAFFVSYLVTSKVLSPVKRLAELVEKADPERESKSGPIADSFPKDEIGFLAQSFDRFTERIRASIVREKEFVSDAGHELRTPLTVIRTSAELLLASDGMTEKAQAKLRNILAAADKMDRLSSGLLELRKESRSFAEPEEVRFPELLYDMTDPLLPFLAEKGIVLEVLDVPGFTSMLPVSELEKVVTNLIRNAAIHSGSKRIDVSASENVVRVRDYGIGIPDSEKQKIF